MSERASPAPVVIPIPSDRLWLDPPFIQRQLYTQFTLVPYLGEGTLQLATPNRLRWAIGISTPDETVTSDYVSAWQPRLTGEGWLLVSGRPLWFCITEYGSLVGEQWWIVTSGGGPWRVTEILRNA